MRNHSLALFAIAALLCPAALLADDSSPNFVKAGGGGISGDAQGNVYRTIPASWAVSPIGVAADTFEPGAMYFFHEADPNPGIWRLTTKPPFVATPLIYTKLGNPNTDGGSVRNWDGAIYAADYNGDLAAIDDNIYLFDRFGNTIAFWETDGGLAGTPCAGGAVDGIIDVSIDPSTPGTVFATTAFDNLIYEINVSDTSGGSVSPSACTVVGTVAAPAALVTVVGIEYDSQIDGYWLSDFSSNTILLVANDGTFNTVLETFNADAGAGINTGVSPQPLAGPPTPLWVTDFSSGNAAVLDSGTFDDCNKPGNPILDCGFETGAFGPNWVIADLATPFFPLAIAPTGTTPGFGFFTSAPTEGSLAALHGFDGVTPGAIRVAQDVPLPPNATQVWFDYRAGWDMFNFPGSTLPRTFDVNIEPAGGGGNLQTTNVLVAPPATVNLDTGPLTGWVDVSAFAGTPIRISFDATVPESSTGPALMQLDNIEVKGPRPLQRGDLIASTGNVGGTLIDVNPSNFSGFPRFPAGAYGPITEIEFRDDGTLFATVGQGASLVLTIDPNTGVERIIGPHTFDAINGLEFVNGTLYGTRTVAGDLVTIDQSTGAETPIGPLGIGDSVAGLAYDESTGTMYGSTVAGNLVTVNLGTGAATVVGPTGFDHVNALEFGPDGTLWGGLGAAASTNPGGLIAIDKTTASASLLGPTGFPGISGLAFLPGLFLGDFDFGNTLGWAAGNGVTCTHDKCDQGLPLGPLCDSCVAQICAVDSYCCNGYWDGICVGEVTSICGISCP